MSERWWAIKHRELGTFLAITDTRDGCERKAREGYVPLKHIEIIPVLIVEEDKVLRVEKTLSSFIDGIRRATPRRLKGDRNLK